MMKECTHRWSSNSGRGGEPDFRLNRQMATAPIMHVTCIHCGDRTWVDEVIWDVSIKTIKSVAEFKDLESQQETK